MEDEIQESKQIAEKANQAYAKLKEDPQAWNEELKERAAWDATLLDDLEDEPPYPDD